LADRDRVACTRWDVATSTARSVMAGFFSNGCRYAATLFVGGSITHRALGGTP
jgi:hypothetical protein